jgi:hypothetical protein
MDTWLIRTGIVLGPNIARQITALIAKAICLIKTFAIKPICRRSIRGCGCPSPKAGVRSRGGQILIIFGTESA